MSRTRGIALPLIVTVAILAVGAGAAAWRYRSTAPAVTASFVYPNNRPPNGTYVGSGASFWCLNIEIGRDRTVICGRRREDCEGARGPLIDRGQARGECRLLQRAYCVTYLDRLDERPSAMCVETLDQCTLERDTFVRRNRVLGGVRFEDLSDCGPVD